jgi:hypothetical protein
VKTVKDWYFVKKTNKNQQQQQNTLVSTLRTRRSKEQHSTDSTNYQNISHRLGRDRLYKCTYM